MTRDEEIEAATQRLTVDELAELLKARKALEKLAEDRELALLESEQRVVARFATKRAKLLDSLPDAVREMVGE